MVKQTHKKYEAKDVFVDFKDDTVEVTMAVQTHDSKQVRYAEVCNLDEKDTALTEMKMKRLYEHYMPIWKYLQGKSKRFPRVDKYTLMKHFIEKTEVTTASKFQVKL